MSRKNGFQDDEYNEMLDLADSYVIPMNAFQLQVIIDLIDIQIKLIALDTEAEYDKAEAIQLYLDLKDYLQSSYSMTN